MVLTLDEIETRLHIHISCTSAEENLSSHIEDCHHLVGLECTSHLALADNLLHACSTFTKATQTGVVTASHLPVEDGIAIADGTIIVPAFPCSHCAAEFGLRVPINSIAVELGVSEVKHSFLLSIGGTEGFGEIGSDAGIPNNQILIEAVATVLLSTDDTASLSTSYFACCITVGKREILFSQTQQTTFVG